MNPQVKSASLVVCLVYLTIQLTQASQQESIENALKLLEQLKDTRHGLTALKRVVTDIDDDMRTQQKRFDPCALSGGSAGYACYLKGLSQRKMKSWLGTDQFSPGKRSVSSPLPTRSVNDLTRKRKGLEMLQRILDEMENDLIFEQKRTCQFNLGGHCATESAANVADHWHYLNSPLSPGRKRRDTRLYKKLVSGKLFQ